MCIRDRRARALDEGVERARVVRHVESTPSTRRGDVAGVEERRVHASGEQGRLILLVVFYKRIALRSRRAMRASSRCVVQIDRARLTFVIYVSSAVKLAFL